MSRDAEQDQRDEALAETCAVALASFDSRACARVQMRDANTILEEFLLPISFPWSQCKDILYKPLPRDIDEMSIIMHGDEDYSVMELNNESFRALKAATIPKNLPICSRRTDDPGILELLSYTKPTASRLRRLRKACSMRFQDQRQEDSMIDGERSLQMYYEVQWKKRQREEFNEVNTHKKLISFRVGGTSSRSTIFSSSELLNNPLFLEATFPKVIQDGVKRSGIEAYEEGMNLGSYNCRQLPPIDSVTNDPTSKNRFKVGRTRLVWSEKERSESKSQRTPYSSIITRQRLEANSFKRPLLVKVGVRLNGVLLSARQSQENELTMGTTATPESKYSHNMKSVNAALDLVGSIEEKPTAVVESQDNKISAPHDNSQCTLNLPMLVNEIKRNSTACLEEHQGSWNAMERIRKPLLIHREICIYRSDIISHDASTNDSMLYRLCGYDEITEPNVGVQPNVCLNDVKFRYQSKVKLKLDVIPPRFDCLPTEDGLINVTCTMPGKIMLASENICNVMSGNGAKSSEPPLTLSLLLNVLANETDRCPACWDYKHGDLICSNCNYEMSLPYNDKSIWINSMGSFWSNLDSAPLKWLHATDENTTNCDNTKWFTDQSCCCLCTTSTTGSAAVSSCAAEGCNIRFHPICAVVASASSEARYRQYDGDAQRHGSNGSRYKSVNHHYYEKDDTYLCTQYSLSILETSFTTTHKKTAKCYTKNRKERTSGSIASNRQTKQNGTAVITKTTPISHTPLTAVTAATNHRKVTVVEPLPIMYCPYHNPKRSHEYYGWYPQGSCFNHDTIRIPPQRDYNDTVAGIHGTIH